MDALLERILDSPPPTEAAAPRRVPALRRVAPAAALLALAGLAAIVAVDLLGSEDEGQRGIVERAAAAVSQEDVIYAITERRTVTTRRLGDRGRASSSERTLGRYWLWAGGRRSRFLVYGLRPDAARGPLQSEITVDGDRLSWFLARSNTISVSKVPFQDWPAPPDDSGYPGFSPASDPGAQLRAHVDRAACAWPAGPRFGGEPRVGWSPNREVCPARASRTTPSRTSSMPAPTCGSRCATT